MNGGIGAGILVVQGFQTHDDGFENNIEIIHPQGGPGIDKTDPDGHGIGALGQDAIIETTVRHTAEEQVWQDAGKHHALAFVLGQPLDYREQAMKCSGKIAVQFQEAGGVVYGAVIEVVPFGKRGELGRGKVMGPLVQVPGVVGFDGILVHELPVPGTWPPVHRRYTSHLGKIMVFYFLCETFQARRQGFGRAVHVDEDKTVPHFSTQHGQAVFFL